jgi:hypothetical protein
MVYLTSYYQRHRDERLEYQKYYRERLKYDDENLSDMNVVESDQIKKRKKSKIQPMIKTFKTITLTFD